MGITWVTFERTGQSIAAMVDDRRVGQVVRYDQPLGWVAFLGGHRLPGGALSSVDEAKGALEAAWTAQPLPSRQPRRPDGGRAWESCND